MSIKEIKNDIRNITSRILEIEPEEIEDDDLFADHDMDSVLAIQLIAMLEDKYDVVVPDDKVEELISINATASIVEELING